MTNVQGPTDWKPVDTGSTQDMPFVAPCHTLDWHAPWRWLRLGWTDMRCAPRQSLGYGLFFVLVSYTISALAFRFGSSFVLLGMLSGFVFLGPVLAIGLYSISWQLQQGMSPVLGYCLREGRRHLGNEMLFAVVLLVVFMLWARAASMVHVFFPVQAHPQWADLAVFLTVGSAVGAVFAGLVFSASAFSLPMIMDRRVDMVTAVVTSINAVLRNKCVMALWAALIVLGVLIGFATAFLGMVVILPLIGHATWHAYRETIDARAWPQQGPGGA